MIISAIGNMKNRVISLLLVVVLLLSLCSCSNSGGSTSFGSKSSFSIVFIDVGQGDAALIECDGHHMLIDGGDKKNNEGEKVYEALEHSEAEPIRHLDILVVSHFHTDHYAGLITALKNTTVDLAISNDDTYLNGKGKDEDSSLEDTPEERGIFADFEHVLSETGAKKQRPSRGDKYTLGSATVEVVYAEKENDNDSLVLLITYKNTRFLFTGDIEGKAQKKISESYGNEKDEPFKIDLIKMPHHGSYENELYVFLRTFMPDYAVFSVGENHYGHPDQRILDDFSNKNSGLTPQVLRTDKDENIRVKSDGKTITIEKHVKFY